MKNQSDVMGQGRDGRLLASFGDAQLLKVDGMIRLRGGSMTDRVEALEWLSSFIPEGVSSCQSVIRTE